MNARPLLAPSANWLFVGVMLVGLLLTTGCSRRESLNESYGRRTGDGANSLNGTSVFAEMFKQAGHRVRSWRQLSPSLEDADVIVWFPASRWDETSAPPSDEAVDWLNGWLQLSYSERVLIIVGRDWEGAAEYWAAAQPLAPPAMQPEFAARLRGAQNNQSTRLSKKVEPTECEWFWLDRGNAVTKVQKLSGPFAAGIDPAKAELEHWSTIRTEQQADTLLADGQGHPLVSEIVYDAAQVKWTDQDSRLILVENAGFLLNGALVNEERRKLAGRLVHHVGPAEKRIVFLEASANPHVSESDPNPRPPTGLELFTIWPIGAVLAQLAALGIVYALAKWPIFGVPRRLERPSLTDFGRHVSALARMLGPTNDRAYAETQLRNYFQVGSAPPPQQPAKAPPSEILTLTNPDL